VHFARVEQWPASRRSRGERWTLIDHDWQAAYSAHPPTSRFTPEQPLKLAKGERLRQTRKWKNTGTDKLLFPTEMCIAFSMYLDDHGYMTCGAEADKK